MIPGLTSALPIKLNDESIDLTQAANVYVTIEQGDRKITVDGAKVSVSGSTVTAYFTQEESLRLLDDVEAIGQINWIYEENDVITRGGTQPFRVEIGKQLLRRVLP